MTLGRAILVAFVGFVIVVGVFFGRSWYSIRSRCDEAEAIELASFPNGFGSKGDRAAPFRPAYTFTCKEMLCVIPDSGNAVRDDAKEIVSGLIASLRIVDQTGTVVHEWDLTGEEFSPTWSMGQDHTSPFPAFRFSPVPPDEYEIQLSVQQPAVALVETPHRVVVKYELCGIERLPATFSGAISAISFLIGGIVAAATFWPRRAEVAAGAIQDSPGVP